MASPYCTVDIVREISDLTSSDFSDSEISNRINRWSDYIDRRLGNPVKVRKEYHEFDGFYWYVNLDNSGVEEISRMYVGSVGDTMLSLPRNGYDYMETASDWGATNCTITADTTTYKSGTQSLSISATASPTIRYPTGSNIGQEWYGLFGGFSYISFFIYTTASIMSNTFTVTIYKNASNYKSDTFTLSDFGGRTNKWIYVSLPLTEFSLTGSVSDSDEIAYLEIALDTKANFKIDNLCFVDYLVPVLPTGEIYWADYDSLPTAGEWVRINYSFDLFDTTPDDLMEACAHLVAADLFETLESGRFKNTSGTVMLDVGSTSYKEDMFSGLGVRARYHKTMANELLKQFGQNKIYIRGGDNDFDYK